MLIDGEMTHKKVPFLHAVKYAWEGIFTFFSKERNGQIQLATTGVAIIFSFLFSITKTEWFIVLMLCGMVMLTEMLNTAIEKLCDKVCTDYDEKIKVIKDVSAGAVLLVAVFAVIIGLMIFVPYLIAFFT